MLGIFAPILGGARRRQPESRSRQDWAPSGSRRPVAIRLTGAIDRAMATGRWNRANRLARIAARVAPRHARLTERLARLRLSQGDPETALRIIEGCRTASPARTASLRLLRCACLLLLGSRAEAHIDLLRWSSRASAPLDARLLLGLLEWQRGDFPAAVRTLQRNLKHLEDPRTLEALALISVLGDRREQTETWARRLQRCCAAGGGIGQVPDVDLLLRTLGLPGVTLDAEPTEEQVNALAMELITFESAIGAVVEAQRRHPHLPTVRLVRMALEQAWPDLSDNTDAFAALGQCSMLLGERTRARQWLERGLARNPMSAPLNRLRAELDASEQTPPGPPQIAGTIRPEPAQEKAA